MEASKRLYDAVVQGNITEEIVELAKNDELDVFGDMNLPDALNTYPMLIRFRGQSTFEASVNGNHVKLVDAMLWRRDSPLCLVLDIVFIYMAPNDSPEAEETFRVLLNYPGIRDHDRLFGYAAQTSRVMTSEMLLATGEFQGKVIEFDEDEMVGQRTRHIVNIARRCIADPLVTYQLRKKYGIFHYKMYKLFAFITLLSQGYLRLDKYHHYTNAGRFLSISSRLPVELQMKLCHIIYDDPGMFLAQEQVKRVLWFVCREINNNV